MADKINWTPTVSTTGLDPLAGGYIQAANTLITAINCTYTSGSTRQITPTGVGDWSITQTVEHYTNPTTGCSSSKFVQKTFQVSGVVSDTNTDFGMQVYEPNGQDLRLDMTKRQPRVFATVFGTPGSPSPQTFNVPITGYGYGGLDEWEAVNTFSRSVYAVTGGTAATSKTGLGYVELTKAALGTNLGVYPDIYTVDYIGYKLIIYRY